jgi:hypothetical protein
MDYTLYSRDKKTGNLIVERRNDWKGGPTTIREYTPGGKLVRRIANAKYDGPRGQEQGQGAGWSGRETHYVPAGRFIGKRVKPKK